MTGHDWFVICIVMWLPAFVLSYTDLPSEINVAPHTRHIFCIMVMLLPCTHMLSPSESSLFTVYEISTKYGDDSILQNFIHCTQAGYSYHTGAWGLRHMLETLPYRPSRSRTPHAWVCTTSMLPFKTFITTTFSVRSSLSTFVTRGVQSFPKTPTFDSTRQLSNFLISRLVLLPSILSITPLRYREIRALHFALRNNQALSINETTIPSLKTPLPVIYMGLRPCTTLRLPDRYRLNHTSFVYRLLYALPCLLREHFVDQKATRNRHKTLSLRRTFTESRPVSFISSPHSCLPQNRFHSYISVYSFLQYSLTFTSIHNTALSPMHRKCNLAYIPFLDPSVPQDASDSLASSFSSQIRTKST